MKKTILILTLVIFTSCGSTKKSIFKSDKTQTEFKEVNRDSTNVKEISKAINDNVSVSLRTNNKVVDSIIKQRLKGFVSRKTSGSNSYSAKFDYDKMVLDIASIIGETENNTTNTTLDSKTEKTVSETTDEYIKEVKKRIPFWIYIVAIIWFLPNILDKIQMIINPLSILLRGFKK
tara:strand:- start:664 stop:1191 length:528 start_codon:yes stop_codon:yes gene_type:complete